MRVAAITAITVVAFAVGCGSGEESVVSVDGPATTLAPSTTTAGALFPDVIDATARQDADGTWTIAATLTSPYDTPERYADGWRVIGPDGTVYGERALTHDHANEQPFTRSQSGIAIPDDVDVITIQGRDQISGWGGVTFVVGLERR